MVFEGKLSGATLVGTTTGQDGTPWQWTGERAPDLKRKIEPEWGKPTSLFNGKDRSEEHTSELQSRLHLVCRLLLEKKQYNSHDPDHPHQRPHQCRPSTYPSQSRRSANTPPPDSALADALRHYPPSPCASILCFDPG